MKKIISSLFAALLLICMVEISEAVVIDFEGLPIGSITGYEYAGLGVVFSSQGGIGAQEYNYGGTITEIITSDNWYHPLLINFVNPLNSSENWIVTSVSMQNHHAEDFWTVTAYDILGNLLDTQYVNYEEKWLTFSGIGEISSLMLDAHVTAFAMDNLTFTGLGAPHSSVPEPATIFLIGAGVLGMAGLRRTFQR